MDAVDQRHVDLKMRDSVWDLSELSGTVTLRSQTGLVALSFMQVHQASAMEQYAVSMHFLRDNARRPTDERACVAAL